MKAFYVVTASIGSIVFSPSVFAYLDPGTGSLMLQFLIAGVLGALATIKYYWQVIKDYMKRLFNKESSTLSTEKEKTED